MTDKGQRCYNWDCYNGHIVIAEDEQSARKLCECGSEEYQRNEDKGRGWNSSCKEGDCFWTDKDYSEVIILGDTEMEEQLVLSSFNAG